MSQETIRNVISAYFAATRAMDVDAWLSTFAVDAVSFDPMGTPAHEGRTALRNFFLEMTSQFEYVGLTEDCIFVAGNGVAVKWTGRGLGKNGREVIFEGIDVFEINQDWKIQTVNAYWDAQSLMADLAG